MLFTKEHQEIVAMFEKCMRNHQSNMPYCGGGFEKADKADWPRGYIYQHGGMNGYFRVFRAGYMLGKVQNDG